MFDDSPITDDLLIQAARKRIMEELSKRGDNERVVNNVYSGSNTSGHRPGGPVGLSQSLVGQDDPFDYFVDIQRRNVRGPGGIDPETGAEIQGDVIGWDKKVHRFRTEKTPRGAYKKKNRAGMTETPWD